MFASRTHASMVVHALGNPKENINVDVKQDS